MTTIHLVLKYTHASTILPRGTLTIVVVDSRLSLSQTLQHLPYSGNVWQGEHLTNLLFQVLGGKKFGK